MRHGTRAKYVHDKCKCFKCKKANRVYSKELRSRNGKVKTGGRKR